MKRILLSALLALWTAPALAVIGVYPNQPTAADPIEVLVTVDCNCRAVFDPPRLIGNDRILITGRSDDIPEPPIIHPYLERIVLDPLPAGRYEIEVRIEGLPPETMTFFVVAADLGLRFDDARLLVKVHWKNPMGPGRGAAQPVLLTPESGYFYFFDWKNVELTVKLLDGRSVNGHYWLFIASMTTLDLKIEVTNCTQFGPPGSCTTKTYVQPAGQNRNFVDISTF